MEKLPNNPPGYGHLIRTFLRISLLGFGGPNAHLALMLDEVVDRKGWITRDHFMHLVGITNLLPGPNSSEVAIHIGYTQRGGRGGGRDLQVGGTRRVGSSHPTAETDERLLFRGPYPTLSKPLPSIQSPLQA